MAMTLRQRALKWVYPFLVWAKQTRKQTNSLSNEKNARPPVSFYSLTATLNNGKELRFENLKGKKVLIVNTASDCGYTPQYTELQKLYQHSKEDLEIVAFPANDFKEQEKGSNEDIAAFCSVNYGVSFLLAKKATVVKSPAQHPVFRWLTTKEANGWNDKSPSWNFAKYLVNEEGVLTHCFEPWVSPLSTEIVSAIHA